MSAQGIESIILDLGYNLHPVAVPTQYVVEVLFLREDKIFKIPLSKLPFLGITLFRSETIPLLDMKEILFQDINYEFEEEFLNKNAFILLDIKNTIIGMKINSIIGYHLLSGAESDGEGIGEYIENVYPAIPDETEKSIFLLNIDRMFQNIQVSTVEENSNNSSGENTDIDRNLDQFTIPDDEDELDIDQFTIPE